jgi:phage shock protein PspC (stress-responsive transcriptional regulator)
VLFVLVGALPFLSGILVYAVLWLLIPEEDAARPLTPPSGRA